MTYLMSQLQQMSMILLTKGQPSILSPEFLWAEIIGRVKLKKFYLKLWTLSYQSI